MNNEVEEFLRRAAQRRAQVEAQLRAQAEARARGQAQPPPQRAEPPRRRMPASPPQAPLQAEVVDLEPELAVAGSRLAAEVAEHMRHTQEIAARVEQLGDRVEVADEEMQAHLQQVFDHSLGRLRKTTDGPPVTAAATPAEPPAVSREPSPAAAIAQMLRTPQNVRNVIVLSEILNRPLDRW
jgi:hypothetical protein